MSNRPIVAILAVAVTLFGVGVAFANGGPAGITGVSATSVSTSTATITWTTATSSTSVVRYATSTSALASSTAAVMTESDPATTTSHSIGLSGLTPNTQYFFEVESASNGDSETDDNAGAYYSFTTDALPVPVVIGISDVASSDVSTSTATISWMTVASSTSVVRYATSTSALASSTAAVVEESDLATTTSHSLPLSGLMPDTQYFFEVESASNGDSETDNNGEAYYSFTTDALPVPVVIGISGVTTSDINTSTATIPWTTATSSTSVVRYATSTSALASSTAAVVEESDLATTTSHSLPLSGLMPDTQYFFDVESASNGDSETDNNGGAYYSFTTDAPPVVIGISGVTTSDVSTSTATITWTTATSSTSVVRYATSTSALASSTVAVMEESDPATTTSHSIGLSGLMPNRQYFYEVESASNGDSETDNNGGAYYSFTTLVVIVEEDDPKRKSFPGVVRSLSGSSVTVMKNGTNELVPIALGEHSLKKPGGPKNRGTLEVGARVVIHARWDGTRWVAIWVMVKPVKPRFVPVVGPVTSIDENGVITILLPNGKTKKIKGPKGDAAPEVGEVVTAFINDDEAEDGDENGSDGKPANARGLVKASKIADRIQAFLEKHSAKHVSIINKLSKVQGFGANSAAKIQKALEKAQAGRAKGNAIAENAKGKSGLGKGNGAGKKGRSIFGPNSSGDDDDSPGKGPGKSKGKGKPKNVGPKGLNNSGNSDS